MFAITISVPHIRRITPAQEPTRTMKKNLYQVLDVRQSASQEAIDSAYSELRTRYKALYDQGDQDASNELFNLNGAYETLINPEKRAAYNEKLAAMQYQPQPKNKHTKVQVASNVSNPLRLTNEAGLANPGQSINWLTILISVIVVFLAIWKFTEPRPYAPAASARVEGLLNDLAAYGQGIAQTSEEGAIHYSAVWPTITEPIRAYKMDFETSHPALMSEPGAQSGDQEYFSNRGKTEVWLAKFCSEKLRSIMSKYGIGMITGDLRNKSGKSQHIAVCTG